MTKTTWGIGAVLLGALLAPALAEDLPPWLVEARAREARLPALADVASEDGRVNSKVPGAVKHKVVLEDGSYSLNVTLDDALTVSCELIPEPRDLANLMHQAAELAFDEVRKHHGTVEARAVEVADAGVVGDHPYLSLQWLYRAQQNGEPRVGALKQYVAAVEGVTLYCANDEIGYVKSFEAVTRALTTHLRATGGEPRTPAHFKEVNVVSLDGQRIGVAVTTMVRDADGDTQVVNASALLIQTAPGQLLVSDTDEVQWVRPDGSLINAQQSKVTNGQLGEDMTLKRQDGQWRVAGKIDGKDVDATLPSAPSTYIELALARRALMARPDPVGASTEAKVWTSLDLTQLIPARATVTAAAGADAFAVREELGGVAIEAVLDRRSGTMTRAKMPLGPRTMTFERVHSRGGF